MMREFGVVDLALFGSTARDEASPESDSTFWLASMAQRRPGAISVCCFIWKTTWAAAGWI